MRSPRHRREWRGHDQRRWQPRYTPPANFNGSDSFTCSVSGSRSTVTYTIAVTVTPVSDAPVGTPIANQAYSDAQTIRLDVSGNFSDIDTPSLTFIATGLPTGLSISSQTPTGTVDRDTSQANGGACSVHRFRQRRHELRERTFIITVSNPAPIARDDAASTGENADIAGSVFDDNGNGADSDPDGDAFVVSAVNGVAGNVGASIAGSSGGRFVIGTDGSYTFVPGADFDNLKAGEQRTTSVTYTISDGQGGTSTATFTVTVSKSNDLPVGSDIAISTAEDTAFSGQLPAATDVDRRSADLCGRHPSRPMAASPSIRPAPTSTRRQRTSTVATASPTRSRTAPPSSLTVSVTVNPIADAPVLRDVAGLDQRRRHGDRPDRGHRPIDDAPATLVYGLQTAASGGTAVVNPDSTYSYTRIRISTARTALSLSSATPAGAPPRQRSRSRSARSTIRLWPSAIPPRPPRTPRSPAT